MSHPNTAADLAMRAVEAGTDRQYLTDAGLEGLETDISDVLANQRHLCDRYGLDYDELEARGRRSYVGDKVDHDGPAERREWDAPTSADPNLALWFTPQAIRDHFDGDDDEYGTWVAQASDLELVKVGESCVHGDVLYGTFREVLRLGVEEVRDA